jgi:hypothetical protein
MSSRRSRGGRAGASGVSHAVYLAARVGGRRGGPAGPISVLGANVESTRRAGQPPPRHCGRDALDRPRRPLALERRGIVVRA